MIAQVIKKDDDWEMALNVVSITTYDDIVMVSTLKEVYRYKKSDIDYIKVSF